VPPTATPRLLRRLNAARVLDAARDSGTLSVTDLVARTGLSRPTVDAVTDDLLGLGWLAEVDEKPARSRRGRPARRVEFRADAGHVVGIDIGEMKVRAAVADLRGDVVAERLQPFDPAADGRQRLGVTRRVAAAALREAGLRRADVLAACVGCTGAMDARTGDVLFSSAFPGLDGVNLRKDLQRTLGPIVLAENDCNLAVIGERWQGVARGVDDVICVLASERMGAGIVVAGQLVRGYAGAAGEMPFLGAYAEEHGAEGVAYLVRRLGAPRWTEAEAVFDAARAGDADALAVVERSVRHAGRAIVTMALVLNPELIVIGGGVAGAGDILLEPLRRQLSEMARLPPRLEASLLLARGVLVGAIRHALDDVEPRMLDRLEEAA
jgi:predicted NBD/HSP70 family sugar kinase